MARKIKTGLFRRRGHSPYERFPIRVGAQKNTEAFSRIIDEGQTIISHFVSFYDQFTHAIRTCQDQNDVTIGWRIYIYDIVGIDNEMGVNACNYLFDKAYKTKTVISQ